MCRSLFTTPLAALLLCATLCAAAPPADQIFPDSTKGFLAIRNLNDFTEQSKKTQWGKLMNDPLMQDFKKELQKQLTERSQTTFGFTFDDIYSLPSGEVAFGMIAIPTQVPGYVLTMDVTGKRAETNEYLEKLTQKLIHVGVKKSIEVYKGQQITILVFPPSEKPPVLSTIRGEITFEPVERRAYYMFFQDVLIAADQLHLLKLIADRITDRSANPESKSLAEIEGYQVVMKRCLSDIPAGVLPAVRWYIEPLDYGESIRILMRNSVAQSRKEKPSIFSILKQQGFDALRGIGGAISVKTEDQEVVYRTFAYTKKPYQRAMRMLSFPDNTNFTPPDWMPHDLARCTMVYVDPITIFDNVGVLFDAFMGEQGVWKDILKGLEEDPLGPKINVREELIVNLGSRVLSMSRYAKPITISSESIVAAVELKAGRESAMLAGVQKLFGTDPEWMATEHRSYKIWHRIPMEDLPSMSIEIEGVPDIFGPASETATRLRVETIPVAQRSGVQQAGKKEDEDRPPLFPEGGVVVAKGCFFVASDIEYLTVILDRLDALDSAKTTIRNESEYKEVDKIFSGMGLTDKAHFFQFFARTEETLRPVYEMVRQGRMGQSQALLGKVLNMVLSPDAEPGTRRQLLDGSSLPEFDRVQHYFGKIGVYGMSEENGFFFKGFSVE